MKLIALGIRAGRSERGGPGECQELLNGRGASFFPLRVGRVPRRWLQDEDDRLDFISTSAGQFGKVQLAVGLYRCFHTHCIHHCLPCSGPRLL
ncbi:MAG: hypothetical protein ACRELG_06535 [Gemmataceae bacterium]